MTRPARVPLRVLACVLGVFGSLPAAASDGAKSPSTAMAADDGAKPRTPAPAAGERAKPDLPPTAASDRATSAQPGKNTARPGGLAHALSELACDEPERVRTALTALANHSSPRAGRAVAERIRAGLPPALLLPAIASLVEGNHRQRARDLVELLAHRRSEVRRAAVEALGALHHKRARQQLSTALEDPDGAVRRSAVTSLLGLGDRRAVPGLLHAHDRGVAGAIEAVGELASAGQVGLLLERTKGERLDPIAPAFDRLLRRGKLTDGVKVRIIRAVSTSPSPGARQHLNRWLDEGLAAGRPRLARELSAAIQRVHERELKSQQTPSVKQAEAEVARAVSRSTQ